MSSASSKTTASGGRRQRKAGLMTPTGVLPTQPNSMEDFSYSNKGIGLYNEL